MKNSKTFKMQLKTERLFLRPLKIEDAQAYAELTSDPRLLIYELNEPYSKEHSDAELSYWIDRYLTIGVFGFYEIAIECAENHTFIGTVNLNYRDIGQQILEIGFRVLYDCQNNGYMTEAMAGIIDYAFKNHDIHKIFCCSDANNKSAIRVFEKLNMEKEGVLKKHIQLPNGDYADEVVYALFNEARLNALTKKELKIIQ
jgi:[ribosomal protein S5]-alanine N-acetyltransferase